jgi:hypothetical protein
VMCGTLSSYSGDLLWCLELLLHILEISLRHILEIPVMVSSNSASYYGDACTGFINPASYSGDLCLVLHACCIF